MQLLLLLAMLGAFSFKQKVAVREEVIPIPEIVEEANPPKLQKKPVPKAKVGE